MVVFAMRGVGDAHFLRPSDARILDQWICDAVIAQNANRHIDILRGVFLSLKINYYVRRGTKTGFLFFRSMTMMVARENT